MPTTFYVSKDPLSLTIENGDEGVTATMTPSGWLTIDDGESEVQISPDEIPFLRHFLNAEVP